jgi:hypothetical protein
MATPQQKAVCVLRFAKSESVIIVQREFRKQFQSDPQCKTNILHWYRQFQEQFKMVALFVEDSVLILHSQR